MTWRDIVTQWVLKREDNLVVLDLAKELVRANIVPVALIDNATLHSILLRQAPLETVDNAVVPKAPQGPTFTYRMNAKEEMDMEFSQKNIGRDSSAGKGDRGALGPLSQTKN